MRNTFDKVVIQMAADISAIGRSRTSLFNVTVRMVITSWWLPGGWSALSMIVQPCRKVDAISGGIILPHIAGKMRLGEVTGHRSLCSGVVGLWFLSKPKSLILTRFSHRLSTTSVWVPWCFSSHPTTLCRAVPWASISLPPQLSWDWVSNVYLGLSFFRTGFLFIIYLLRLSSSDLWEAAAERGQTLPHELPSNPRPYWKSAN